MMNLSLGRSSRKQKLRKKVLQQPPTKTPNGRCGRCRLRDMSEGRERERGTLCNCNALCYKERNINIGTRIKYLSFQ
jgi:hypothetical protein